MWGRRGGGRFLFAGLIVSAFVLLLYWWFGRDLSRGPDLGVVYMGGFLVLLLAGLLARVSSRPSWSLSKVFGQIVIWMAVGLVLIGGYSYRAEMRQISDRILGEIDPARGQAVPGQDLSLIHI